METNIPFEKILPFFYFFDSNDRICITYLLSGMLIGAIYFFYKLRIKSFNKFIKYFLNPKILFHRSARTDLYLFIFNYWLRIILIVPLIFSELEIIKIIKDGLTNVFPNYQAFTLNPFAYSVLYSLVLFIVADFFRFLYHYISHKNALMWELHKIHHSAITLNPLTTYRVHPADVVILIVKQIMVTGLVAGIFSFLINGQYVLLTVFGVQLLGSIINFFGANLRHSHIPISFGKKLETIFVSPVMHQMHHAINRNNNLVNLGSNLTIWDKLFKTYYRPDFKPMRFGLSKSQRSIKWFHLFINPIAFISDKAQKMKKTSQPNLKRSFLNFDTKRKTYDLRWDRVEEKINL